MRHSRNPVFKAWIASVGGVCCFTGITFHAVLTPPQEGPDAVLIFTGDIRGYLSPCGCTKPQVGGILRMATVVRALLSPSGSSEGSPSENHYYVDIGNWVTPKGRQDELKAETIAEVLKTLNPAYLNVGPWDARLGSAYLRALNEVVRGRWDSSLWEGEGALANAPGKLLGNRVWIIGAMPEEEVLRFGGHRRRLEEVMGEVPSSGSSIVLLFAGDLEKAKEVAQRFPQISLILYSSQGEPTREPVVVGNTLLVSPGDKGRYVGRIELRGGRWENLRFISLGPEHSDDPSARNAYRIYTERVSAEKLLEALPRVDSEVGFVGTKVCATCHVREYEIWKRTTHSRALKTLEDTGNDRDPECVGCHVVGLSYRTGFRSREETPELPDVGCESCHGPGAKHSQNYRVRMGKVGEASCKACHVPEHSPNFDFKTYWQKIRH